jgi:hypothetical protein
MIFVEVSLPSRMTAMLRQPLYYAILIYVHLFAGWVGWLTRHGAYVATVCNDEASASARLEVNYGEDVSFWWDRNLITSSIIYCYCKGCIWIKKLFIAGFWPGIKSARSSWAKMWESILSVLILASANLIPDIWVQIYNLVKQCKLEEAQALQRKIQT